MSTIRSVLQVNTTNGPGGAATVTRALHRAFRRQDIESWVVVGRMLQDDPNTLVLDHERCSSAWARAWTKLAARVARANGRVRGARWLSTRALPMVAAPERLRSWWAGREDFAYPATARLLSLVSPTPQVLHLHNLHGGYFDLRVLPALCSAVPTVITMHDSWLLAGHCAHSFSCERWRSGCGGCPDLAIPPPIRRDASAPNWQRKRAIYDRCSFALASPSQWLLHRADASMLRPAAAIRRVVHTGVDTAVFSPGDAVQARRRLGLPIGARVLLFAANGIRNSVWKDYPTLVRATGAVAEALGEPVILVGLGDSGPEETAGRALVRFRPYAADAGVVADYYRAADVYVHAARADSFPTTILEAMACATPVVATAVGGIPEQVRDGVTGYLAPPAGAADLASAAVRLIGDSGLRLRFGQAARDVACREFSLERMAADYLRLYEEVLGRWDSSVCETREP